MQTVLNSPSTTQFLLLLPLIFFLSAGIPAIAISAQSNGTDFILTSCSQTLYPNVCYSSLSSFSNSIRHSPAQLAQAAIHVSLARAQQFTSDLSNLSRQAAYLDTVESSTPAFAALRDCISNMADAIFEMRGSLKQMRDLRSGGAGRSESFEFQMSNVQTWMSAALTDEETCVDGFEEVSDGPVKKDVRDWVVEVKMVTSNALALVNSYVNKGEP